jgi:hypothetical protein
MSSQKMFSNRIVTIIVLTTILYCNQIIAQERTFAAKGTLEISGSIAYSSLTPVANGTSGDAISIFALTPQISYFIQDGLALGLSTGISFLPGVTVVSPSSGDNVTMLGLFFTPSYNFQIESKSIYPFIEGQFGYTSLSSGSTTLSGFSYGGKGGMKMILVDHILLNISAQYTAITFNPEGATKRTGFNYLTFGIGIGAYL